MIFSKSGLEVRGGFIFRVRLMRTPFDKEAVGEPSKHAHDPHPFGLAHAASIVVLGDIQTLVQTIFDTAKSRAV